MPGQCGDVDDPAVSALKHAGQQQPGQQQRADQVDLQYMLDLGGGVLSTLTESGPLTQIDLATTMAIDRTAMVYLLDDLEQQALVERVRSPQDRRAFLIHLTPPAVLRSAGRQQRSTAPPKPFSPRSTRPTAVT